MRLGNDEGIHPVSEVVAILPESCWLRPKLQRGGDYLLARHISRQQVKGMLRERDKFRIAILGPMEDLVDHVTLGPSINAPSLPSEEVFKCVKKR
jgi:hypothetical protein